MGYEQTGDSYLDRYSAEKNGFAGIVEADLTDNTFTLPQVIAKNKINLNANNWGALPLLDANGKQISYDRSYNPNLTGRTGIMRHKNAFVELKQKINDQWNAKLTYNYLDTKHNSRLLYYYGYPKADGSEVFL